MSSNKTLDGLADDFLSGTSHRTELLGLVPLLKPNPLPAHTTDIDRLRTLVERRAWGDVLKLTTTLLTTSSTSKYPNVYASLLISPDPDALVVPLPDINQIPFHIRNETVEIMMLQCHAWLKLRRYTDLVTEVERWNFWMQNDTAAQSPSWLPWSMYVLNSKKEVVVVSISVSVV
jgi:hypothetical protein